MLNQHKSASISINQLDPHVSKRVFVGTSLAGSNPQAIKACKARSGALDELQNGQNGQGMSKLNGFCWYKFIIC